MFLDLTTCTPRFTHTALLPNLTRHPRVVAHNALLSRHLPVRRAMPGRHRLARRTFLPHARKRISPRWLEHRRDTGGARAATDRRAYILGSNHRRRLITSARGITPHRRVCAPQRRLKRTRGAAWQTTARGIGGHASAATSDARAEQFFIDRQWRAARAHGIAAASIPLIIRERTSTPPLRLLPGSRRRDIWAYRWRAYSSDGGM